MRINKISLIAIILILNILCDLKPGFALEEKDKAINFSLTTLEGRSVSLDEFKGKVIYLDIWASWCGPCRYSLPFMNSLFDKYSKEGLTILAVNIDTEREKVEETINKIKPKYTVLLDPENKVPEIFQPGSMPTSYIIGRNGTIRSIHSGFNTEDSENIFKLVEAALKEDK